MMRPLKYFLYLFTALSGGYGYLCASDHQEGTYLPTENLNTFGYTYFGIAQNDHDLVIRSSSPHAEKSFKIDIAENEVEEDELIVSRKHIGSNNGTSPIAPVQGYFFGSKRILPVCGYAFYSSSYQYLIFQVFRI